VLQQRRLARATRQRRSVQAMRLQSSVRPSVWMTQWQRLVRATQLRQRSVVPALVMQRRWQALRLRRWVLSALHSLHRTRRSPLPALQPVLRTRRSEQPVLQPVLSVLRTGSSVPPALRSVLRALRSGPRSLLSVRAMQRSSMRAMRLRRLVLARLAPAQVFLVSGTDRRRCSH
jgi:hypothetical protein